jgi:hypothetical protein
MESRRPIHTVGIEQRERRVAERRGSLDERFGERGALQEAEGGGGVEFDIHAGLKAQATGLRFRASTQDVPDV